MEKMIEIRGVRCAVEGHEILKGLNLTIGTGEVHAIMGPNGTGKSTLSHLLAGHSAYELTEGTIHFKGKDLSELTVDERAREGIFMAFQAPVEIPGVPSMTFLKAAVNGVRKAQGREELDSLAFLKEAREKAKRVGIDEVMLRRAVNHGFSGGEKKRFEALQMLLLNPSFAILDETDSGLDIDAMRTVASVINGWKSPERAILIITHYKRLLNYIAPDVVHILSEGRIVRTGGVELADLLEKDGYRAFAEEVGEAQR